MKLEKFVQALPIALAVQSVQLPAAVDAKQDGQATDLHAEVRVPTQAGGTDIEVLIEPGALNIIEETVEFELTTSAENWVGDHADRFEELVEKDALGTITGAELKELDRLQKMRRRFVNPPTATEILQRHRREKLDRDMQKALRRYVRFQPFPKSKM